MGAWGFGVVCLVGCGESVGAPAATGGGFDDVARVDDDATQGLEDRPTAPGDRSPIGAEDADFDAGVDAARDAGAEVGAAPDVPPRDGGPGADSGPRVDTGPMPPEPAERTLRVLHWNIAGGKENDCQPALITRAVVRYVRENNVDFVGLNEVCPSQHEAIESALRSLWGLGARETFAGFVGDGTARVVGNAVYSRFGLQNITRLEVGTDQYGARNLLCGQLPSLPHLRMCSVHLTPGDAAARVQLRRVFDRVEQWWSERRDTVIVSGDLNLTPNDEGLNDVYAAAANTPNNPNNRGAYREVDDDDATHCRGYGERSLPGTAGGPCMTGGKIDFIFARSARIVDGDYAGNTFDIPGDCTGVCSDHRAVFGRLRLRIDRD